MKIKYYLVLLALVIIAILIMGFTATMSLRASGLSFNSGMKYLFPDIEKDLILEPDTNNGFVVNPYQTGNPDQSQALIIGASVSYILREVKAFTLFAVALAVLALIAYIIIAFIVLNRIVRQIAKAEEPRKKDEAGMRNEENVSNKETDGRIEDRSSGAAGLSLRIDEMLSDIDTTMERSKVKWSLLL